MAARWNIHAGRTRHERAGDLQQMLQALAPKGVEVNYRGKREVEQYNQQAAVLSVPLTLSMHRPRIRTLDVHNVMDLPMAA